MEIMNNFKNLLEGEFDSYDNDSGKAFWGNVGAGVLCIAESTGRMLISYRSKFVNEPHTWGIVGGKVDDEDKNIKKAVAREFKEETSYQSAVELIPAYVFKTDGFTFHNFIGVIPDEFRAKTDWETEKFEWMTFDQLKKLKKKHFGLEKLLQDSKTVKIIKRYI